MSFHKTPTEIPVPGELRADRVTLTWNHDGLTLEAEHLNEPLHFGEGDLMSAQLSTSTRASGRRWWLLSSGEPEPWIHLIVRLRRGITLTLSAKADEGDAPDALPALERAGYVIPIATLRALFQTAEALGARTSHRNAYHQDEATQTEIANFTTAKSPVRWPPELEPPPDPPPKWDVMHKEDVRALAFAPDASVLGSIAWDGRAYIWSMETGQSSLGYEFKAQVNALACSPVETLWAMSQPMEKRVVLVRGEASTAMPLPHFDARSLAFSPDGRILAAACIKGLAVASIDRPHQPIERQLPAWSVAFSPQGRLFVGIQGGDILEVSPHDGQHKQTFATVERGRAIQLCVSADGRFLAAMRKNLGIWIWNLATKELRAKINGRIASICWTPHGYLVTGLDDGTIRVWSFETRQPKETILARGIARVQAIAASADGYWLAWGDDKGLIVLWDVIRKKHHIAPQKRW